jgi:hypothetical protein
LDEGTLVALRDGDSIGREASAHLVECRSCDGALDETRTRSAAIAEMLASLDGQVDVERAKVAVRRRLDARREATPTLNRRWRAPFGRAAAILLLSAGAASALPWSPVRTWWVGEPEDGGIAPDAVEATGADQGAPAAGISVAVPQGRIAVIVRGAEAGSSIDVLWVDGPTASLSAGAGSGFAYADGRAEVDAAPGAIEVRLPRAAAFASLEVDGRVFLRRSEGQLDVPGPVVTRSDSGVRFVVPGG